ncbi:hypothetical protein Tco_0251059, partial [Tanacetum coccineum]
PVGTTQPIRPGSGIADRRGRVNRCHRKAGQAPTQPKVHCKLFNGNNLNIRYWSGITAAAGTGLAPNGSSLRDLDLYSFNYQDSIEPDYCYLLSLPTVSGLGNFARMHAFLGCGSRFSSFPLGIVPNFVTTHHHIGQYPLPSKVDTVRKFE